MTRIFPRRAAYWLALAALSGALAGCQVVQVRDQDGKGVPGASVTTKVLNDNGLGPGPSGVTNSRGDALLWMDPIEQDPVYLCVAKPGYLAVSVDFPKESLTTVTLQKVAEVPDR